jgi:hypothetical protein
MLHSLEKNWLRKFVGGFESPVLIGMLTTTLLVGVSVSAP